MNIKQILFLLFSLALFAACAAPPPTTVNTPLSTSLSPQVSAATNLPSPTVLSSSTITLTPVATLNSILETDWAVPAQKLDFDEEYNFINGEWDETSLHLSGLLFGDWERLVISSHDFQVITPTVEPTPVLEDETEIIVSGPNGISIKCVDTGLEMLDADQVIVAKTSIIGIFCDDPYYANNWLHNISWTESKGGAFAFLDEDKNIYIWEVSNLKLNFVGVTNFRTFPIWNPSGTQVLVLHSYPEDAGRWSYVIAYRDGREHFFVPAELSTRTEALPHWLSDEIIMQYSQCGQGCSIYEYFHASTGKLLTGYSIDFWLSSSDYATSAYPWILLPQIHYWRSSHEYQLYNFETLTEYNIAIWPEYQFELVGWEEKTQSFLLVREPSEYEDPVTDERYTYSADITYGYLRFYPDTRSFEWILRNTLYVDQHDSHFFALTINPEDQSMSAGIYDMWGEQISGGSIYSNKVILTENVTSYKFRHPYSWAWSNAGDQLIYADYQGDIWLLDVYGNENLLVENISINDWPYFVRGNTSRPDESQLFIWSPDDSQILAIINGEAWIITP